jgi:hypothetical protein
MRRVAYILVFLGLVQERPGDMFEGRWESIFSPLLTIPTFKLPIKLSIMDLLVIGALLFARSRPSARSMRARPLDQAIWASLAAVAVTEIWGVIVQGGDGKVTFLQLHPFVMMLVTVFMLTACLRTPRDFLGLGKTIVAAALFRAAMAWWFYFFVVRGNNMDPAPAYMTSHFDTVTFVAAIAMCASYALEVRSRRSVLFAIVASAFILVAVQLNNRRLAWVSLICALAVLYGIFPSNQLKKKFNRRLVYLTPLFLAYVVVGTGRTEGIFKPLRSLSSATGGEGDKDSSTRARDYENLGVVVLLAQHPLMSTGWGHQYTPLTKWYTVEDAFKETWSVPHNNLLMMACFNGALGFMGMWIVFPVGMYFAARTYRVAQTPVERAIAASSIATATIYWNQVFGDMGFISFTPAFVIASSLAAAGRMATHSGAWPTRGKSLPAAPTGNHSLPPSRSEA